MGYRGLAACMAAIWASQLSPIDAHSLTLSQRLADASGSYFELGCAYRPRGRRDRPQMV